MTSRIRTRSSIWTALLAIFAISAQPGHATGAKLMVPAYGNPCCDGDPGMWDQLTDTASGIGSDLIVILNPNSGPGASPIDPNYITGNGTGPFVNYRNAGGAAIGYVKTEWAARPIADVQADVDLYFTSSYWSGAGVQIDGIFFDEMSNDLADVGYYQSLRDYVRGHLANAIVVGNPGTTFVNNETGQSQFSVNDYAEAADILMTFETVATEYFGNYTPPSWVQSYAADRFAHVVYDLADVAQMREAASLANQRKAGHIYLTDDSGMNPYDMLASYWQDEVDAALNLIFADGFETGDLSSWAP